MEMGLYQQLESPLDITTTTIIKRIVANHEAYQVYYAPFPAVINIFIEKSCVIMYLVIIKQPNRNCCLWWVYRPGKHGSYHINFQDQSVGFTVERTFIFLSSGYFSALESSNF